MMEVVRLKTLKAQDQDAIIEKLAKYLLLAKQGCITGVVITAIMEDGAVQSGYVGNWTEVLGALRITEHNVIDDSAYTPDQKPDSDDPAD